MRIHQLRMVLLGAVLAGLPACTDNNSGTGFGLGNCPATAGHEDIEIPEPATPPMQLRIESCRVDVGACPDLCTAAFQEHNVSGFPSACKVSFDSSHAYVSADISIGCATAGGTPIARTGAPATNLHAVPAHTYSSSSSN